MALRLSGLEIAAGDAASIMAAASTFVADGVPIYGDHLRMIPVDPDEAEALRSDFANELKHHRSVRSLAAINRPTMKHAIVPRADQLTPWSDDPDTIAAIGRLGRGLTLAVADRCDELGTRTRNPSLNELAAVERRQAERFTFQAGHAAGAYLPLEHLGGSIVKGIGRLDDWDRSDLALVTAHVVAWLLGPSDYRSQGERIARRIWNRPLDTAPGGPFFDAGRSGHLAAIALSYPVSLEPPDVSDWASSYTEAMARLTNSATGPFHHPLAEIFGRTGRAKGPSLWVALGENGPEPLFHGVGMSCRSRVVYGEGEFINSQALPVGSLFAYAIKGREQYSTDLKKVGRWLQHRAAAGSTEYEEDKSNYDQSLALDFMQYATTALCRAAGFPDWGPLITEHFSVGALGPPFRAHDDGAIYLRKSGLPSGHLLTNFIGSLCNTIAVLYCLADATRLPSGEWASVPDILRLHSTGALDWRISSDDVLLSLIGGSIDPVRYRERAAKLGFTTDVIPNSRIFLRHFFGGSGGVHPPHRMGWSSIQGILAPENTDPAAFAHMTGEDLGRALVDYRQVGPKRLGHALKAVSSVLARTHAVDWAQNGFGTHPAADIIDEALTRVGLNPRDGFDLAALRNAETLLLQQWLEAQTADPEIYNTANGRDIAKFLRWLGYIKEELGSADSLVDSLLSINVINVREYLRTLSTRVDQRIDDAIITAKMERRL